MRAILITAAGILVWTMFILGCIVFLFGTLAAISAITSVGIIPGLITELFVILVTALVLASPVVLKASQDILRHNSDDE